MMAEIAVFGHECIFDMNGYSYAFHFYRVLSQKHQVKLIVPKREPFMKKEQILTPHMSLQIFGPSMSFFMENLGANIYHFSEIADKDGTFVEKAREAVGDARVIIADTFTWGRFIARVFPDKRLIVRSLDVEQTKVKEIYAAMKMEGQEFQEDYFDGRVAQVAALERGAYQNAEHIMVLTKGDAEDISMLYAVPSEKISLLPLCVHNIETYRGFRPEKHWNLNGKLNVFFIGFLKYDNLDTLQIIAKAAAALPEFTFHICGRYVLDEKWKELEKKLPGNVLIYGQVSDEKKRELIQHCDCALNLSSQTYGMNTKLLDYMLCGTPIISTRIGVRGYSLREYEHYFPCERDELCVQLQKFAMLPGEERKRMADAAYDVLFREHDYEKYWPQIEKRLGLDAVHQDKGALKNKYIIFGCGLMGEQALRYLNRIGSRCVGFTDNNVEIHGKTFQGQPVFPPEEAFKMIMKEDGIHLLIATGISLYLIEMYRQAAKQIADLEKLEIYFRDVMNPPEIDVKLLLDADI